MEKITVKEVEYLSLRLARETISFNEPIPDFKTRYPNILESSLTTSLPEMKQLKLLKNF